MPKSPQPVVDAIPVTLKFTAPGKPSEYGMGFVVRFAVAPKVGDIVEIDQYSVKQIPEEELHQPRWKVVDVHHDVSLSIKGDDELSSATLWATVHPV